MMEIMGPLQGPKMLLARMPIQECDSIFSEDIPRATQKRLNDHNSGRLLPEKCVQAWGLPLDSLEVLRTEHRAPYLSWINGVWRNEPLPGISIGHCEGWAVCALIEAGYWIGIDAERKDRQIQENAFDMMAKGDELNFLIENSKMAIETWTAKEASSERESGKTRNAPKPSRHKFGKLSGRILCSRRPIYFSLLAQGGRKSTNR